MLMPGGQPGFRGGGGGVALGAQVAQAYYESSEQHYPTYLINFSYDNIYKTLYENYPISP